MRVLPLLVALLAATSAAAETTTIIAPVFGQLVTAPLPAGFVPAREEATDTSYINEAVPQGETIDNWSQLVTLSAAKGLAVSETPLTAKGFAEFVAGSYTQACPDSFSAQGLEVAPLPGVKDLFAGYLSCGTLNGVDASESMVFLVMVGAQDIYTVQWAEHGPASATPIVFPGGVWVDRLAVLHANARLCDIIAGEAAPYPSCVD